MATGREGGALEVGGFKTGAWLGGAIRGVEEVEDGALFARW